MSPQGKHTEIPRSRIRSWVIGQQTKNAKIIVVRPRDFREWLASIERQRIAVEKQLADEGFIVVNDEGVDNRVNIDK